MTTIKATVAGGRLEIDVPRDWPDGTEVVIQPLPNGARDAEKTLADSFNALKCLEDGWNSYSAPAPSPAAIENAKALVKEAKSLQTMPERVEPSVMGGVGLTFSAGHREVVVEFYNKGTAHALFTDETSGDMRTEAVATDPPGYRKIIGEVRKYLHGE